MHTAADAAQLLARSAPESHDYGFTPRDYQNRAHRRVRECWAEHRSVCLVSPTGSGKTAMGSMHVTDTVRAGGRVLWLAHTRELIRQACDRLQGAPICPGMLPDPTNPVQVATVQTLLARDLRPPADLLVLDEGHHYAETAAEFSRVRKHYGQARILGLTATPERQDGSPLGDVFSSMVVAASYSELLNAGHLAECVVYAPPSDHAESGWAMDPIAAYERYAEGSQALVFLDRVQRCREWAARFVDAGVSAHVIEANTPSDERDEALARYASGRCRVLLNVACLTEGVDLPSARTVILGRCPSHPSLYLQIVGRVLRPHPDKPHALLIDLVDATSTHGYPTEDREYSLTGEAIQRSKTASISTCLTCGAVYPAAAKCPQCGWERPPQPPPQVRIYNVALQRVYAGQQTAPEHKAAEWERLRVLCKQRDWSITWAVQQYRKLFHEPPPLSLEEQQACFHALRKLGQERGWKPAAAAVRFKSLFDRWPPRQWSAA